MKDLTIEQVDQGLDFLINNASSLVTEAELLLKEGHFARSFALAHLSKEELAKVTILFATGYRIISGDSIDWGNVSKMFSNHISKLTQDELFEIITSKIGDREIPSDLAELRPKVKKRNSQKNASFYVNFDGDNFTEPSKEFTKSDAEKIVSEAKNALKGWKNQRKMTPTMALIDEDRASEIVNSANYFTSLPRSERAGMLEKFRDQFGPVFHSSLSDEEG